MALPTLQNLKDYLRVETTAEDTALAGILARAGAAVRYFLDRPLEEVERTYTIYRDTTRAYPVFTKLVLPNGGPISVASGKAPAVTDVDGTVVDADSYTVDADAGVLRAIDGEAFAAFPYRVVVTEGLATRSSYATVEEPLISNCILDFAAELYQHRNPGATQESTLGVSVAYGGHGLPPRLQVPLMALRRVGIA